MKIQRSRRPIPGEFCTHITGTNLFLMKLIYIASPYTIGNMASNVRTQLEAAHCLLDLGHCPHAPLLNHYLDIHRQRPEEDWMAMDFAIIYRCDILLRLPGQSRGADREVAFASDHRIPVAHGWEELQRIITDIKLQTRL